MVIVSTTSNRVSSKRLIVNFVPGGQLPRVSLKEGLMVCLLYQRERVKDNRGKLIELTKCCYN